MGACGGPRLLWLATLLPAAVGQFGGNSNWTPPPPDCPAFTCPAKQKPVARQGYKAWAYGCKESGVNFFDVSASFDASDPLSGLRNQKSVDKCCVEKEICMRTCGMTALECHNGFQKCSKKICKGDQNCNMMAQIADIVSVPLEDEKVKEERSEDKKCSTYNQAQQEACECVATGEWQGAVEARLKAFYQEHNPTKLNKSGEIKDTKQIWKQWKGKEPEMFFELTKKYKAKAVEIRQRPKPNYSKFEDEARPSSSSSSSGSSKGAPAPPPESQEADGEADFSGKLRGLEARKDAAKAAEDFDLAEQLKADIMQLQRSEVQRLRQLKAEAVKEEDFLKAKELKQRIAELDPKNEL